MDDIERLHMMQLSDSFFPSGTYTCSSGLETLYLEGRVTSGAQLVQYIRIILERQIGPCDCAIFAGAHDAAASGDRDAIADLDSQACAIKAVRESREAAVRSGGQLLKCIRQSLADEPTLGWYDGRIAEGALSGVYPVSLAVCACALGVSKREALLVFVYGSAVSMVSAALRLGIIDHFEGQRIIHELKPAIRDIARRYSEAQTPDIWQFAPQAEIFQMRHEAADIRMFAT